MFVQVGLLAFLLIQSAAAAGGDFSRSYVVWVSVDGGHCTYWLTDVGLDARQLTEELRDGYETAFGLEILTQAGTPPRCVSKARKSALKAGFTMVRARRGTEKDRSSGIS